MNVFAFILIVISRCCACVHPSFTHSKRAIFPPFFESAKPFVLVE